MTDRRAEFAAAHGPAKGAGLLEAAANSPSLTLCDGGGDGGGPTAAVPDDGTSTTVDVGDGVVLT